MPSKLTIYATLPAQVEERDGHWCAIQDSLGLVAHGNTAGEASTRLNTALNLLIDELLKYGGKEAVVDRLKRAGILFTISESSEDTPKTLPLMLGLAKPLEPA